jgi:HK97 family phage portal protein
MNLNPLRWFSGAKQPENAYKDTIAEEKAIELLFGGYGVPTTSGMVVNEQTAMRISVVYRCVSLIAGTIASLPCEVYRYRNGKSELAEDHPAYWLLHDEPNPLMTANTFWKNFVWWALMRGNGYGLIGRTAGLKAPVGIALVKPSSVIPDLSVDKTHLVYTVATDTGEQRKFGQDDMLHYPFIGWDGKQGRSPLECAREAVGLAAAAQEFNERFFSQGNAADIAMEFPGNVNDDQMKRILDIYQRTRSGMEKQRLPLISTGGCKISRIDFNAEDSQLLESRSFQVEDICRFYGVPPHMVGHTSKSTSWGSGVEEQTLGFVKFTLRDILKGLEQEVNRKLLKRSKYYCKFNLDALLRADSKGRSEFYKAAVGGTQSPGFMTVNEVRALENLPPLEGGDTLFVPVPAKAPEKKEADNAE